MDGFPVTVTFRLHWSELDALGHVNNARYFTWFETARIECFRQLGLATDGTPETGPILAHTSCDFLEAVHYPEEIVVGTRISRLGTTSFGMDYRAARASTPDKPVARGKGVVVLIDYRTGEKKPLPDDLRRQLEALG